MKKKGQALVEFIIILPIFILLIFGIFDMGNIMISKMNLENQMSDVVSFYKNGKDVEEIKEKLDNKYEIKIEEDNEYVNLKIIKEISIITPGLQLLLNNPYEIEVKRSILNE